MEPHDSGRGARIGRFNIDLRALPTPDFRALLDRLPNAGSALRQLQDRIAETNLGRIGIDPGTLLQAVISAAGPALTPPAARAAGPDTGPAGTPPPGSRKKGPKQQPGGEGSVPERDPQRLETIRVVVEQSLIRVLVVIPIPRGIRISQEVAAQMAAVLSPIIAGVLYDLGYRVANGRRGEPGTGPSGA